MGMDKSYVNDEFEPTQADVILWNSLQNRTKEIDSFPFTARWFSHIASFDVNEKKAFAASKDDLNAIVATVSSSLTVAAAPATTDDAGRRSELNSQIENQGATIRKMKSEKASKEDIDTQVKVLLDLKAEYKKVAGEDWKPAEAPKNNNKKQKNGPKEAASPPPPPSAATPQENV